MHSLIPIIPEPRACLGITCDVHARCEKYHAVDGSDPGEQIATCMTDDGYPLFVEAPAATAAGQA